MAKMSRSAPVPMVPVTCAAQVPPVGFCRKLVLQRSAAARSAAPSAVSVSPAVLLLKKPLVSALLSLPRMALPCTRPKTSLPPSRPAISGVDWLPLMYGLAARGPTKDVPLTPVTVATDVTRYGSPAVPDPVRLVLLPSSSRPLLPAAPLPTAAPPLVLMDTPPSTWPLALPAMSVA